METVDVKNVIKTYHSLKTQEVTRSYRLWNSGEESLDQDRLFHSECSFRMASRI